MFQLTRQRILPFSRSFSASSVSRQHVSKVTLVGNLVREPEKRVTKSDSEYVAYTVVTNTGPPDAEGKYAPSYHRIVNFRQASNDYLLKLKKGSLVYVEAQLDIKEADPNAEPGTLQSTRQIMLKHDDIRVLATRTEH